MKVLHAVHGYPPEVIGGTELYVARLARELKARGHDVHVFAGSLEWRPALAVERSTHDGIPVTRIHRDDLYFDRWDKGFHPGVGLEFERALDRVEPDIVHVHHWIRLTTNLVALAARRGIPAVVTAHDLYPSCPRVFRLKGAGGDEPCEEPMGSAACVPCVPRWRFQRDPEIQASVRRYRADMRRELELAARVVAPSSSHGEFLGRMLGFTAARVVVLPHGALVDAPRERPRAGGDGRIHLAYWGHLHPLKGAHVLVDALRRSRHKDRFVLDLHGESADPDYRERLESLAEGLDIRFRGWFRFADLCNETIDVAVIPTLCRESYSFILDEAALLGAAVVATRGGALEERATGRVLGFEQNDSADLARVLDRLVDEPQLLQKLRAAPSPALLAFSEHAGRIEALYRDAHAEPRPAPPLADDFERLQEEWARRETAFQELVRIEKWEDVVEEQRGRIAELERLLRRTDPPADTP